jgi:hypothetical protein
LAIRIVPRARRPISSAASAVDREAEQAGVAGDALGQLLVAVVLQVLDDAEARAQGSRDQPRSGGGADQREAWQLEADRAGGRTLTEDDVDLVVLHGRVEVLLGDAAEAVDLVDEQDVAVLEGVGQDRGQVAGLLDGRDRW